MPTKSWHKTAGILGEVFFAALLKHEEQIANGEKAAPTKRPLIYLLVDAREESLDAGPPELTAAIEDAIRCWVGWRDPIYETLDDGIWAEGFASWKKEMFPWI